MKILPINPRAILIDLDGTLADSLGLMYAVYCQFIKKFSIPPSQEEFHQLSGPGLVEIIHQFKEKYRINESEAVLMKLYRDLIAEKYLEVSPCVGAASLLKRAQEKGCTVGLVTSNFFNQAESWLKRVALFDWVDYIVSAEHVKQTKPHPEPYLLGASKAGCDVDSIIAVEDSFQGAQAAIAAGLKTFQLTCKKTRPSRRLQAALPLKSLEALEMILWEPIVS